MQSHQVGCIQGVRLGSNIVEHSYPIEFSRATAVAITLGTIPASLVKPALVEGFVIVQTASDGTTHTLAVSLGGAALVAAADMKGAANTKTALTSKIIVADSDLVATPTITGTPTVGRSWVCVQARELNVNTSSK